MPKIKTTPDKSVRPYLFAVGRRKEAVARVRLYNPTSGKIDMFETEFKKGDVIVNGKPINEYFRFTGNGSEYVKMLKDLGVEGKYIFSIKVTGGGIGGQYGALIHGMARVLDKIDRESFHGTLKEKGYLTRDSRTRERRKVGNAGKARRKKSSPKR